MFTILSMPLRWSTSPWTLNKSDQGVVYVSDEVHKQLLHRVGSSRSDGLQKSFPLEGEQHTRNFVRNAIGFESIKPKEK